MTKSKREKDKAAKDKQAAWQELQDRFKLAVDALYQEALDRHKRACAKFQEIQETTPLVFPGHDLPAGNGHAMIARGIAKSFAHVTVSFTLDGTSSERIVVAPKLPVRPALGQWHVSVEEHLTSNLSIIAKDLDRYDPKLDVAAMQMFINGCAVGYRLGYQDGEDAAPRGFPGPVFLRRFG